MNSLQKKLQEKYNDWRDKGKHSVNFFAINKLLDDKYKNLRENLEKNYLLLQEKRQTDPKERLKIIRKRLKNYHKHENSPYAYYQTEIDEVRTLLKHAPADIEFLLRELDKLQRELRLSREALKKPQSEKVVQ